MITSECKEEEVNPSTGASEDEEEELFEDAIDSAEQSDEKILDDQRIPSLEESLEEVFKCLNMALNNQFQEALEICEKWSNVSLYHALGRATLCFLKGVLTLGVEEIQRAMNALKKVIDIYNQTRKQSSGMSKVVWKPNYNNYSDELCYAESLLMTALLTFLEDQNLMSLVKGAFRIRNCYQSYKECNVILNNRTNWKDESIQKHFESGVRMGFGTFNLMISHLPARVLKLLEFVGFSGNRQVGIKELDISTSITDGLRSPLAVLIMMAYHCYVEHLFGVGEGDLNYVAKLLDKSLEKYRNSAFFLLFAGRLTQLNGQLDDAIVNFKKCITIQDQWKQIHNICYWELLWCFAIRCDWENAAKFANMLRAHCRWSPATYTYQYAVFLYMIYKEEEKDDLKSQVTELMGKVPSLRIRYAGKTIPAEKFAITSSEKYFHQGEMLLVPGIELLYIWNIFPIMEKEITLVDPILEIIEKKLKEYEHERDSTDTSFDNYGLLMLLKGMCLGLLNYPLQAVECFLEILQNEKRMTLNTFIPPHASMELGITHSKLGEYKLARQWLEKARREYTGYLLETMVHFCVHCALRSLKELKKSNESILKGSPATPEDEANDDRSSQVSKVGKSKNKEKMSPFHHLKRKFQSNSKNGVKVLEQYNKLSDENQTKL